MAAPGWFRYKLARKLTEAEAAQVKALAGPIYAHWAMTVSVHENVAWVTERLLTEMGLRFYLEALPPRPEPIPAITSLAELREWVPAFLAHYQVDFIEKMGPKSGVLAVMPTGCLAGDTTVAVNRGGKSARMRLDHVVSKFNGGGPKPWDLRIRTNVQSVIDGQVRLNEVVRAVATGVKPVHMLRTATGEEIKATADHVFFTPRGEVKLGDLRRGDEVLREVWPKRGEQKAPKLIYKMVAGMQHHPHASEVTQTRKAGRSVGRGYVTTKDTVEVVYRVPEHRLVVEADLNGLPLADYIASLRLGVTIGLQFLPPTVHVHHRDGNVRNNARGNLEVLSEYDHLAKHANAGGWRHVAGRVEPTRITFLAEAGEEPTFDLTMASPHNNYVANGLMVHNSGKSLAGIVYGLLRPGLIVFVTRAAARRTICGEVRRYTTCEPVLLEGAGAREIPPGTRFAVVGWESLQHHYKAILAAAPTTVIFDECFPAGTMITTQRGDVPIEKVTTDDCVLTLDAHGGMEWRKVLKRHEHPLRARLVRVTHEHGSFICTENHEVCLGDTDKAAGELEPGEALQVLRRDIPADALSTAPAEGLRPVLLTDLHEPVASGTSRRECEEGDVGADGSTAHCAGCGTGSQPGADAPCEPHAEGCDAAEGGPSTAGTALPHAAGRQREATVGTAADARGGAPHGGAGARCGCAGVGAGARLPLTLLEAGSGLPEREAGDRGERDLAQGVADTSGRRAEGYRVGPSRVVRVDVLQHGGDLLAAASGGADPGCGCVYDLTIEVNHNFFADGVNVHNSHVASNHKRREAVVQRDEEAMQAAREEGKVKVQYRRLNNRFAAAEDLSRAAQYRLALTATPIRDRVRNLWGQVDLLMPRAWGSFYPWAYRYAGASQNPWGGINTDGRGGDAAMAELVARLSFCTYYIPQSVTHRDLPPLRRQVTYIPPDELSSGRDVLKELKEHGYNSAVGEVWAKLAHAAAMKRERIVDEVVSGAFKAPDGRTGGKVVVFTGLRADAEKIAAVVKKVAKDLTVYVGHGGTAPKQRDEIREAYMAHPGPCVLVGTGDSWGESLNLQQTDLAIIAMLPWTPGQIRQWEGRFKRHGMTRPVLIMYLVAEGTADEHVAHALLQKLPAVEMVAKDEVLTDFAVDLRGDEEAVAAGFLAKLMASDDEDKERDPDNEEEDPNRLPKD